jgi:hypothetical protein
MGPRREDNLPGRLADGELMTAQTVNLGRHIASLIEKHGGLRPAARAVRVNYAYLSRLGSGEKINPTPTVLRKLGLRKVVTYELIRPPVERMKPEHAAIYHGDIDGDSAY